MTFDTSKLQSFLSALTVDESHLGLIVTDEEPQAVVLSTLSVGVASLDLTAETDLKSVLSLLQDCAKRVRWCRINVLESSALSGSIYNQLRLLSTIGHLDIVQGLSDGKEKNIRWPSGAKIVIVVNEHVLKQIKIPTFLNLFGSILR